MSEKTSGKMNDLHEILSDERAFEQTYRGELAGIGASDEARARMKASLKARLAEQAAAASGAQPAAPAEILELKPAAATAGPAPAPAQASRRPARRIAGRARWAVAAGLVAALLFGGGSVAVATGAISVPVPQAIHDLFGGSVADTKIVNKVGRPVGASASSNGVTVTADAIVGDASNVKIIYTVARDDGKPFDLPASAKSKDGLLAVGFDSPGMTIDGTSGMGGGSYFYDADPSDNKIQYVEEWNVDVSRGESLIGKTVHVDLRDLKLYSADEGANAGNPNSGDQSANVAGAGTMLAKGQWKFDFKINYEDSSKAFGEGATIEQGGMKATIKKASISPIALTIEYTVDGAIDDSKIGSSGMMTDEANAELDKFYNQDYVITMKDGSQIKTSNAGGSSHGDAGKETVKRSFFFDKIIDVDQVASVTVNGTELMGK